MSRFGHTLHDTSVIGDELDTTMRDLDMDLGGETDCT